MGRKAPPHGLHIIFINLLIFGLGLAETKFSCVNSGEERYFALVT